MQTDITEEGIQRYRDALDEQEVPQKGRCLQYQGVIYRQGDHIPPPVRNAINRILDNHKLQHWG